MSDVAQANTTTMTAASADERIGYRGPIQRLLVSPEIGAIIGAVLVWAFFWGNGLTFGTASTTLNVLDAAAPLGIMAVVVALLMISGEFDLSAGVMTGATGILTGLMAKYFMGDGAPMWLAVAAAFLAAGLIGWFNGTVVNKTGLPSFIVTLASFFVLKGVTLVIAKRLEDKVVVADVEKASGFDGFKRFFAEEYKLDNFSMRNGLFLLLVIGGLCLVAAGLSEQSFVRRESLNLKTLPLAAIGVVAALGGLTLLHRTDGVSNNLIWGAVAGVGAVGGAFALGAMRYRSAKEKHHQIEASGEAGLRKLVGFGVGTMILCYLTPLVFDRNERKEILTWFPSGLRIVVAVVAAGTGVIIVLRHVWPGLRERRGWYRPVQAALFAAYVGLCLLVGTLAFLQLATVQALRAIAMLALATIGLTSLFRARGMAARISHRTQLGVGVIIVLALLVLAWVVRNDAGAVRFRTGMFTALLIAAGLIAANTLLETQLLKRNFPSAGDDRRGRRLVALGAIAAVIGLAVRVVFTNLANDVTKKGSAITVVRMSVVWWVVATLIGSFVLTKTKWGNWIFAVGGNKEAARAIGVPANRVKTGLFVTVSLVGCFVGVMTLLRYTSVQANQGDGQEFLYIIAAVVGGNLLTGGYGSVIGASVGALIIAMSNNGIGSARWNQDGKFAFQGAVLLIAVLVNNFTRKKAQEAR